MTIDSISGLAAAPGPQTSGISGARVAELGQQFLQLLVTQMQNQNPLDPREGAEFLSDLAQMTSVEQLTAIRESLGKLEGLLDSALAAKGGAAYGAADDPISLLAGQQTDRVA